MPELAELKLTAQFINENAGNLKFTILKRIQYIKEQK